MLLARVGCALIATCVGTHAMAQNVISQAFGGYPVGLRVIQQYDRSREYKRVIDPITGTPVTGERSRPVQTLIWYPAAKGGTPLRYRDYMATRLKETNFDASPAELQQGMAAQAAALTLKLGLRAETVMNAPVLASRDAPIAAGRYPVVIYAAGGFGFADENADLAEYLASHGYVVIASTSLGAHGKPIGYDMSDAEPQIGDIEFLLGYAQSLPDADMSHVAVLGWSWGGMNNLFAAARDSRIGALISLDGTREPTFNKLIDVRRLTAPWLYISRAPETIPQINRSEVDTSFSLLNAAKYADVYQLTLYPFHHPDMASQRQHEADPSAYGEYSKEEVRQTYNVGATYIRNFLDAYLKGSKVGFAFLGRQPVENGAAPHTIFAETHLSNLTPATRERFAADLAHQGFGHAVEAYNAAHEKDLSFSLTAQDLKGWGYALMQRQRPGDASAIFTLWTVLYPRDWDAFDSLGEAYEAAGNRSASVASYRQSLVLNPNNANATTHLSGSK
ncbi:dienelactone hydrolase family protein [Sphingomonas sp. BAUL-RG-20F-R05-02]|uniref:dienelactone hydrolase family protein n=1 Tax=Sphingomonas sp. BAUL-RG-20F-R05-02 TaxID=2914830 RepID=UPI001F5AB305|nr:dienelactone hydrolase family protein [Sphingomonas sp. BAUL-RG-20F-R05-02]